MHDLVLAQSQMFGDVQVDLWRHGNEIFMTSEQIGQALDYAFPAESVRKIRDRYPERFEGKSVQVNLTSTDGKQYATRIYNEQGIYEVIRKSNQPKADEFYDWVYEVLSSVRKTGTYSLQQPQSIEDLIILQAQSVKELKAKVQNVEQQIVVANHRIDSLDRIDIDGDSQQRLNKMIQRYAHQEGLTFPKAWREFTDHFNTAYRTNLTARVENYKDKHGLKDLTRPQFLSIAGLLDDAIRVADKMLNHPVEVYTDVTQSLR